MTSEEGKMTPSEGSDSRSNTATPQNVNIAMHCVLKGNISRFNQCFENEEDPYFSTVTDMLNERNDDGKSPLDMAALLGRIDMMKELINKGADPKSTTTRGYSALHHAAAWGKVKVLQSLVAAGADLQQTTSHGEQARDTALRYNQTECVDYLDWAEAKTNLVHLITTMRETIADPEKVQGRLARDDRNLVTSVCNEKNQWMEDTPDATTKDFIIQKQLLEDSLQPVLQKLSEPPPEKK